MIWWEDFRTGDTMEMGRHTFTEEEILTFARQFDPQPFHADAATAGETVFGGLIASGWHTACVFMRLFADGLLSRAAALGSPGVDELRWLRPVRPGDTLEARLEILEVRPSRSKPDRGIARLRSVMINQDQDEVLSFVANVMFRRRPRPGRPDPQPPAARRSLFPGDPAVRLRMTVPDHPAAAPLQAAPNIVGSAARQNAKAARFGEAR